MSNNIKYTCSLRHFRGTDILDIFVLKTLLLIDMALLVDSPERVHYRYVHNVVPLHSQLTKYFWLAIYADLF